MSQGLNAIRVPWMEQWRESRMALVKLLRAMGYVPADQHGTRRDDAEEYPHISILRERAQSVTEKVFGVLTAGWIGTVFFPSGTDNRLVIEVFGRQNLSDAGKIAWRLRTETGVKIEVRLAHPNERTEEEDCPHVSNVENWGATF